MKSELRSRWRDSGFADRIYSVLNIFLKETPLWKIGAITVLAGLILFLSLYDISAYPSPDALPGYIDDAQHLLASRDLALTGKYDFGPALGLTVFLPVAGAMRIFGASTLVGHLVMVVYLLVNLVLFYSLVRYLGNWKVAVIATLIYVIAPGINVIYLGRRVMGEVPAVAFTLGSILAWFKALGETNPRARVWKLLLSGFMLGMAIVTKNQFLMMVPAWLAVWGLNWLYYRQARHVDFFLPVFFAGVVILVFYGAQFYFLPNGQLLAAKGLSQWTDASSRGLLTFSAIQAKISLRAMSDYTALFGLALPSLLYAALRSVPRSGEGLRWSLLFLSGTGWLAWFILLSVGWYRYAFPGLTFSAIFVAFFFYDATGGFNLSLKKLTGLRSGQWDIILVGRTVLIGFLLMVVSRSVIGRVQDTLTKGCDSHIRMADYIAQNVPAGDVVETYNPEICWLSGHACHLPPGPAQDAIIRYVYYKGPPPYLKYPLQAPYLLLGYPSFASGLYNLDEVAHEYYLEVSMVGEVNYCRYDLYHTKSIN